MTSSSTNCCFILLSISFLSAGIFAHFQLFEKYMRELEKANASANQLRSHFNLWTHENYNNRQLGVVDFNCVDNRIAPTLATSVHGLKPTDISIVAAIGDSLTAGLGAGALTLAQSTLEYRGLVFSIGGDDDLSIRATIPNILRQLIVKQKHDQQLIGASHQVSTLDTIELSQLNVAKSGSTSVDLLDQAIELVRRIRLFADDKKQDIVIDRDWKLVTIFIGSNDLCDFCTNKSIYDAEHYRLGIENALDYLHEHLPKTLVNIVSVMNLSALKATHRQSDVCRMLHENVCPCLTSADLQSLIIDYQQVVHRIETNERYLDDDYFGVIVSTALETSVLPTNEIGDVDLSLFAPDCFHFSQITHNIVARLVWNNMMEPYAHQSTFVDSITNIYNISLKCPNLTCPFIRTISNTASCSKYVNERQSIASIRFSQLANNRMAVRSANSQRDDDNTIVNLLASIVLVAFASGMILAVAMAIAQSRNDQRRIETNERTPLLTSSTQKYSNVNNLNDHQMLI